MDPNDTTPVITVVMSAEAEVTRPADASVTPEEEN